MGQKDLKICFKWHTLCNLLIFLLAKLIISVFLTQAVGWPRMFFFIAQLLIRNG